MSALSEEVSESQAGCAAASSATAVVPALRRGLPRRTLGHPNAQGEDMPALRRGYFSRPSHKSARQDRERACGTAAVDVRATPDCHPRPRFLFVESIAGQMSHHSLLNVGFVPRSAQGRTRASLSSHSGYERPQGTIRESCRSLTTTAHDHWRRVTLPRCGWTGSRFAGNFRSNSMKMSYKPLRFLLSSKI